MLVVIPEVLKLDDVMEELCVLKDGDVPVRVSGSGERSVPDTVDAPSSNDESTEYVVWLMESRVVLE